VASLATSCTATVKALPCVSDRLVEGIRDRRLQGNQIAIFPKNEYWRCRKIEDSSLMKRIYGRSNSRVFAPYGKV
jgi:hypothetical protein